MADPIYPFRRPQPLETTVGQTRQADNVAPSTAPAPSPASGSPELPTSGDPRQAALQMLLDKASLYGDQGASTATIQSILGGVDMGRADRVGQMYATRQKQLQDSASTYLDALSAALTKQRQRSLTSRRSSGGGSNTLAAPPFQFVPFDWRSVLLLPPGSTHSSTGYSHKS